MKSRECSLGTALVDLGRQGLQGEKGDRKEARKSQRREKELPRRKERRGRRGLWGGHMGDYKRASPFPFRAAEAEKQVGENEEKVRLSVHF